MAFRLRWPSDYIYITQLFGANPAYYSQFWVEGRRLPGHEGLDIRAYYGTNIYACAAGVVYESAYYGNYGQHIRIQHPEGFKTIYAHLRRSLVFVGQKVDAGQLIGFADSTGNSSGSHLHLSLKKDGATARGETNYPADFVNPISYMDSIPQSPIFLKITATSSLRLRSGPSTAYSTLAFLPYNTRVTSLEDSASLDTKLGNDAWVRVMTSTGIIGYCYAAYLQRA